MSQIIFSKVFSINGNKIGIVLTESSFKTIKKNLDLQKEIIQFNKEKNLDSIGILKKHNSTNYSLKIFEPNSSQTDNQSAWSNTCGNALIAVNKFLKNHVNNSQKFFIKTDSGIKKIINQQKQSIIDMGKLFLIEKFNSCQQKEIDLILNTKSKIYSDIWFGYLSNRDDKRGEPHLMLEIKDMNLTRLYTYALSHGPKFTNNKLLFKNGINTNIVSILSIDKKLKKIKYYIVTYERNLGLIPEKCITGSCGTGALTTFAFLIKKYHLKGNWDGYVISKNGTTNVRVINNNLFLIDPAV